MSFRPRDVTYTSPPYPSSLWRWRQSSIMLWCFALTMKTNLLLPKAPLANRPPPPDRSLNREWIVIGKGSAPMVALAGLVVFHKKLKPWMNWDKEGFAPKVLKTPYFELVIKNGSLKCALEGQKRRSMFEWPSGSEGRSYGPLASAPWSYIRWCPLAGHDHICCSYWLVAPPWSTFKSCATFSSELFPTICAHHLSGFCMMARIRLMSKLSCPPLRKHLIRMKRSPTLR